MRIYVDFNAWLGVEAATGTDALRLDRMGTLRDLCAAKILCVDMIRGDFRR